MTDSEFRAKWKKLSDRQRKFCLKYIENGFDAKQAAIDCGYNSQFIKAPTYRIMRKIDDVIDYLIAKNNTISTLVKPAWIYKEYIKLYNNTNSEITKQNVLKELSKLLEMQTDAKIQVTNNIPTVPVQIVFDDNE